MEEFLLYGATPDIIPVLALLSAAERPHYGALDFLGNPRTLRTDSRIFFHRWSVCQGNATLSWSRIRRKLHE